MRSGLISYHTLSRFAVWRIGPPSGSALPLRYLRFLLFKVPGYLL